MKPSEIDSLEQQLLQDIEDDSLQSVPDLDKEIAYARQMVKDQQRKDQRMNIRISRYDLEQLKSMALEEGVPYQTFVTGILHKFIRGKLQE